MISSTTAQQVTARLGSADWALKSEVMAAAVSARDDDHFWQLLGVATPDTVKVGPKGYIHGWIFVGAPGVGALVNHPSHGKGTVTAHDGKHVTVKFDRSGATHTFEARKGDGKGKLVERAKANDGKGGDLKRQQDERIRAATHERMQHEKEISADQRAKWDAHNADRVMRDPKHISTLKDEDLKGVDRELTRRAAALGKPGKVSATHQKVKDELSGRGAGGKVTGVSQESGKNYEELRRKAISYNATSPPKEGSALRTYSDPEKQKEAIRLHTEARRAAPDAKSKKLHTDAINQHKAYLAQIEHNQNMARFNKDKADTEAKIKDLNARNYGSDPKVYDDIAAAHDHLADLHEQHQKDLTAAGYGGQHGHEVAADKARGRADAARENAAHVRARQDAAHAKIKEQMPGAEAKVAEWEKTARQSGKKEDIERAASGHEQIARHAGMIGDQKRVDSHTAAAAELRNLTPTKAPRKSSGKKPVEGVPEDEKIKTPWGTMHPADVILQHPGAPLTNTKEHQDAIKELDRRGATSDGKDKVSRARRQVAKDLASHEAHEKEYNKPGGRGDMVKAKQRAKELSEKADKENTSAAHDAAAAAHREALTLSYRHEPGQSLTQQYHNTSIKLHEAKAERLRASEPKPVEQQREEYKRAASVAPDVRQAKSPLHSAESHERSAKQHRRAAELATTDAQRAKHEAAAKTFDEAAAAKRKSDADEKAANEQRARETTERIARDRAEREAREKDAKSPATQHARRVMLDPDHAAKLKPAEAQTALDRINRAIDEEKPTGANLERAQRAKAALEKRIAAGAEAAKPQQGADKLSAKAKRTGTRADHVAAGNAQYKAGNRSKGDDHRRAVESIDMSNEYKDDAEIHADAAEKTGDPEAHDSAAENYRNAAEHMDDVPGGKKQAAALRAKADDHEAQAKNLRQKIADYVKAFTHANKLTNAARKSGTASAHQAAAAAHRVAAQVSLNGAQVRHHRAEVARHTAAAKPAT